jgi:hypothetical protein
LKTRHSFSFLVLLAAGFASACSAEHHELGRQSSPDQKLVAILIESSARSAQGDISYDLYIDEVRASRDLDKPILSGSACEGLSFYWLNDYTLQVHYPSPCRINRFTNRWFRPSDVAVGKATPFEIILLRD